MARFKVVTPAGASFVALQVPLDAVQPSGARAGERCGDHPHIAFRPIRRIDLNHRLPVDEYVQPAGTAYRLPRASPSRIRSCVRVRSTPTR